MKRLKNKSGITLIALVITIIVLLILAGVAINLAIGERGIFSQSKLAVEKYKDAQNKEEEQLQIAANAMMGDVVNIRGASSNNYSTEEQVVGTWIDGRPLYQKTVDCGALTGAHETLAGIGNNIAEVKEFNGYLERTSTHTVIPIFRTTQYSSYQIEICYLQQTDKIQIEPGSDIKNSGFDKCYVTIKYTKTTDGTTN